MPGPCNGKKKRRTQGKSQKMVKASKSNPKTDDSSSPSSPSPQEIITPPPGILEPFGYGTAYTAIAEPKYVEEYSYSTPYRIATRLDEATVTGIEDPFEVALKQPYIYDPGNGPRVRNTRMFLSSSFFAQRPAYDDPMCAEFAQEEVLQMLMTVLPEDLALILWYNKSRATSRICPSCQRLYRLGDTLAPLIGDDYDSTPRYLAPQQSKEQRISGLCSPVCFVVASLSHPAAIKSAWGRMTEEIDDVSWELLNTLDPTTQDTPQNDLGAYLSMLLRMTRLHDLGLGQLCVPELDMELSGLERKLARISVS
ncbi:hypothetical protein ONZ45_g4250 [Pleurotus djamor]|nr:hypothetical protein ONZ45_g4250 [Pleurotus djamor]